MRRSRSAAGGVFLWELLLLPVVLSLSTQHWNLGIYVFTGSSAATDFATGSFVAPLVEESLRVWQWWVSSWSSIMNFDSVLDGII